jgi:hypothetical protein
MRRADKWIADDGTVFEGANAYRRCYQYEQELAEKKYEALKNWIRFFNWKGEPIAYDWVKRDGIAYYAQVLGVPNEDFGIWDMWCEVVPSGLGDMLAYESDCGIWVSEHENDEWVRWETWVSSFEEKKKSVEKIMEGE